MTYSLHFFSLLVNTNVILISQFIVTQIKKGASQHPFISIFYNYFASSFTFATTALKASAWFMAKSANTLRLISIPAL